MIDQEETPTDRLYDDGIPLDVERIIGYDIDISSPVKELIDWEQPIEMDAETRFAVLSAVAHYHYVKTSNVLLCEHILSKSDVSAAARRIAWLLLERNGEELAAWSEYVKQNKGCGPMGSVQLEYNQVLWDLDGVLPMLLGIQNINLAADTSYDQFQDGESVFLEMTDAMREHNTTMYPAVKDAFRDIIEQKRRTEKLTLLRHVAQQVDMIQFIAEERSNKEIFKKLGTTDRKLIYGTGKAIKAFYSDIGLVPDIL